MTRCTPLLVALVGSSTLACLCACAAPARTPTVNQPPVPVLTVRATARVGETVQVDGEASQDPGGAVSDAHLLFGDGSDPAGGLFAEHAWQAPGLFLVELYIVDDAGASARARARVQITP